MSTLQLRLERKGQEDDGVLVPGAISITPSLGEDYWAYRVIVGEHQAVLGFPKFGTVGIGFAVEKDESNVNLPYSIQTSDIWNHIKRNKGDEPIADELCIQAIRLIQEAVYADKGEPVPENQRRSRQGKGSNP